MASIELLSIEASTADEFLQTLSSTSGRWEPDPGSWIFRGQADAEWKLVPSILRGVGSVPEWRRQQQKRRVRRQLLDTLEPHGEGNERLSVEWALVDEFARAADSAGLHIPEDNQLRRNWWEVHAQMLRRAVGHGSWPPAPWLSVTALAQHYGVPTRLLDWSWKSRVAAYFAAVGAIRSRTKRLAVWCLDSNVLLLGTSMVQPQDRSVLATAPYHGNPNLAAQSGVFTVDYDARGPERPFEEFIVQHLQLAFGRNPPNLWAVSTTPFVVVSLPTSNAGELLRKLALDHISAATVFPGYAGVAKSLQEQELWDRRPWDK